MKVFVFLGLMLLCKLGFCQANLIEVTAQGLIVGDQVPKNQQLNVINYLTPKVSLEEFTGKLIILDFWATWCSPCISSFPKLDSLQSKFKEEIQIIPVTYENLDKAKYTLEKVFPNYSKKSMPFLYADNYLRKLFPHKALPHCVWISPKGTVLSVTGGEEVNSTNIQMVLEYLSNDSL